jgi:hypothetical protein
LKNGLNLVGKSQRTDWERLEGDFKGRAAERKAERGTCAELWSVIPAEDSVMKRGNLARPGSLDFGTLISSVLSQTKRAA